MNRTLAVALALAFLAACSGNRSIPPTSAGLDPALQAAEPSIESHAKGTLVLTLPAIAPAGAAIPWLSAPNWLSSATRSAIVTFGSTKLGTFALSATSPGCANSSSGLICTITASAPSGERTLTVQTYASTAGTGSALATADLTKRIYPGQQNLLTVGMTGIARRLGIRTLDKHFTHGQFVAERIVAVGIDAGHRVIPSSTVVGVRGALPLVTVQYTGFLKGTLSTGGEYPVTSFPCCGVVPAAFPYDGVQTGSETLTLSAQGYHSESTTLDVVPGNVSLATLLTMSGDASSNPPLFPSLYVAQFASNANGNASPVRAFVPTQQYASVFGEDASGNFWVGSTHYSNVGAVLGTIALPANSLPFARDARGNIYVFGSQSGACTLFEYPSRYGTGVPIREVDYPCAYSVATVDAAGDIFASNSFTASGGATVAEYPAGGGSGSLVPSRTISLPPLSSSGVDVVNSMDCDAAGNVYVENNATNATSSIYKIAPGATSAKQLISGVPVQWFAVDDRGDIYARAYVTGLLDAIEVYPAGSSTPTQTIEGALTELDEPATIAVARSWAPETGR